MLNHTGQEVWSTWRQVVVSEQNPPIQGFLNKDYKNCGEGNLVIIYCCLICLLPVIFLSNCSFC